MHAIWHLLCFSILGLVQSKLQSGFSRCNYSHPCDFEGGNEDLRFPPEEKSANGLLSFTLNVDVTTYTIEWLTLFRRTYNGQIPGPTWRVRRSDRVNVVLRNRMTSEEKTIGKYELRYPNETNIHTHGLHISSQKPQDNVFVHVKPGKNFTYRYQINQQQPPGTFFYHAHRHGSVFLQVQGGMAGMLIVEDEVADMSPQLNSVSCPENCHHDIILCFQPLLNFREYQSAQTQIRDNPLFRFDQYKLASGGTLKDWLNHNVDLFTTNGQLWPRFNITIGQMKRFRLANTGGGNPLGLLITDVGGTTKTSGCEFKEIALDGIYLDAPRPVQRTLLVPSGRADWLVVCKTPGTYQLRSVADPVDQKSMGSSPGWNGTLLTINVQPGDEIIGEIAADEIIDEKIALPQREWFMQDFRHLPQDQLYGRCVFEVNTGFRLNRERFENSTFTRCKIQVNCVNEFYLTNSDPSGAHPIHIHINHYQVISYNNYTGPYAAGGYGPNSHVTLYDQSNNLCHYQDPGFQSCVRKYGKKSAKCKSTPDKDPLKHLGLNKICAAGGPGSLGCAEVGDFRDVILVPPLANITVRFMSHQFTGEVAVHCHILDHEDYGLMLTFAIVDENQGQCFNVDKATPGILAGDSAPGTCHLCDPFPFNQVVNNCSHASSPSVFWGSYGPFDSGCKLGKTTQTRRRQCMYRGSDGPHLTADEFCDKLGSATQTTVCPQTQPTARSSSMNFFTWSGWTQWGACSSSCGSGVKRRSRICYNLTRRRRTDGKCTGSSEGNKPCWALCS